MNIMQFPRRFLREAAQVGARIGDHVYEAAALHDIARLGRPRFYRVHVHERFREPFWPGAAVEPAPRIRVNTKDHNKL